VVSPSELPGSKPEIEEWIDAARLGSLDALGRLLETCRPYLLLMGNQTLPSALRPKLGASDLVQETLMNAQRGFQAFRGRTEAELLAWLKQILFHQTANTSRHYGAAQKRAIGREVRLEEDRVRASRCDLAASDPSPSQQAQARERDEALERALGQLPTDYFEAIRLRQQESCSFEEIGRRMKRSPEAARKLWTRAILQLRELLEPADESR
jgi:RNA polymerase sigma-70 factor (ECF subfamily)